MGIYFGKDVNFDEYDPEIEKIKLPLHKNLTLKEFTDQIHEIFKRMFFPEIAGNKIKYKKLAKELYDLLRRKQ